jgi:hypothetical protein
MYSGGSSGLGVFAAFASTLAFWGSLISGVAVLML